ncbi:hypothetical protein Enr10x_11110 [Gimesia panareensis]|uniref:DUF4340 domain-containing protein n=1 Tax=Gimesia panareensis TaxID=2527978 RepID=A0A517Q2F8_9PLAN|nr:DUF4340 domain-containing protein [Gimesia panareensis]QDT25813.1 hypothetical protein Enr10x_11110 [Gimesia panareensis]
MNETTRTLTFVGIAVVALIAAFVTDRASQPVELTGYENVGQEFYPDFTDPTQARSLRVVSYDEDSATLKVFNVEFKDGAWRIPSHHDYPADAEDELAETAASLVGVVRGALESRRKSDHERFGVIDPLDESNTNLQGRGQRLTLAKEGGAPLVDFIIGKQVPEQPGEYYVRKVDEDSVYRTKLNVDLSSDFSDWIEPDLLKVDRDRLVEIIVNKYSIDEANRSLKDKELSTLKRQNSSSPWELEGLNKETEKLNTADVNQMINTLVDLKIQGIRPKPAAIAAELKKSGQLQLKNAMDFVDLQSKGFIVARTQSGGQMLVSNEGEVIVITNQGVVYSLYFGEIFTGSTLDIEVGNGSKEQKEKSPKKGSEKEADQKETASADKKQDAVEKPGKTKEDDALKTSRYLFVTVTFDPSFIGDPPQKPTEPKKPADLKEKADGDKPADAKSDDKKDEKQDQKADEKKPDPAADYAAAMKKYESELKTYEKQLKEYDEKVIKGQELVQQLNERFADWYYVISANSFEKLRMSRSALVEPADKPNEGQGKPGAGNPGLGIPGLNLPGMKVPAQPAGKPAVPKPAPAKKPAPVQPKGESKPAAGKPETKPESSPKENAAKKGSGEKASQAKPPEKAASPK